MPTMRSAHGEDFETGCEMVDVTSLRRPDTAWAHTDRHGHRHRWFTAGAPATIYRPGEKYEVPSLVWIIDGYDTYEEDDEPHAVGHYECRDCGEPLTPGVRADDTRQYLPGLRWYRINGEDVSPDEFERRLAESRR